MGVQKADVLIVGGGVIGLACARQLLDEGRSVRLIERGGVGAGASHGNCGLVTPSHALPLNQPGALRRVIGWSLRPNSPVSIRPRLDLSLIGWALRFVRSSRRLAMERSLKGRAELLLLSRTLYDEWMVDWGEESEWDTLGLLLVFAEAQSCEAEEAHHELLAAHGVKAEMLDRDELLRREPALKDELAGGAWYSQDAHLRPDRLVAAMARDVAARGAQITLGAEVTGFETRGGRLAAVTTTNGGFVGDQVVLAAGAWTEPLARQLGVVLPMQPGKGYSLTCERPGICPTIPMILEEVAMGVTPWASGLRLAGTLEFAGFDESLRPERLKLLRTAAQGYLREIPEVDGAEEWCGLRAMTPDDLPIVDRIPHLENAILATGHGRLGVSMAPGTGRLVADMVMGREPTVDIAPYGLSRFG
ncbi:MAG: D-amino-acid dehydrogenase [Pseudohongiellaceae bacterium]|jgi:D-amino-acid dehydrogenase